MPMLLFIRSVRPATTIPFPVAPPAAGGVGFEGEKVRGLTESERTRICYRDGFVDRLSPERFRLVYPGAIRVLSLLLDGACAVIKSVHFELEILWALDSGDPSSYTITRTVRDLKDPSELLGASGDRVFAGTFTHIIFTLVRGVRVEDVIDAIEGLPDAGAMSVSYPSDCSECCISVEGVDASVRCTGLTLELVFGRAGSPRELFEAFEAVRAAFRFTNEEALTALL